MVITSPIECAEFARLMAKAAFEKGARDVTISWRDELFAKTRFLMAPADVFDEYPSWLQELYLFNVRRKAAFISISASDPELLKDVDPDRVARADKAGNIALQEFREQIMNSRNAWCVVSVPTESWAKKVFPDCDTGQAVEKLWEAIFKSVRVDLEDPVAAWRKHNENFRKRVQFLNEKRLRYLKYRNSLGTDLVVELPGDHVWMGGSERTPEGVEFFPNMPTEEIFTLPKKDGVNGRVVASMPLNYNGTLIDNFAFTFKDGRVVEFSAGQGSEALAKMLETDEGARYLGEVALVPQDSPIARMNILFYNTLFDENASSHLALGKAYPVTLQGGENMTEEELRQAGVNDSLIHVDFMIGTGDMDITGVTASGEEVPVFRKGNFAF